MDTKALRQKILDLAIHGRLVRQDPNDEPASVLLQRIREEKERLIKEGKIKKGKKSAKTSDTGHYENVPFEVPSSWEWTTLGEIIQVKSGDAINVRNNQSGKFPIYGGNGITGHCDAYNIDKPTIVIGRVGFYCGSVHKTMEKAWITDNAFTTTIIGNGYEEDFLVFLLKYSQLRKYSNSTAQPVISGKTIYPILVPLPPLAEQHRIVAEIERWFSLIDIIESGKASLQTAVKQAKSKILDLAIHGRLVSQNPNDEPAGELLRRINPKAEIGFDNVPFEVPSSWVWTTLGEISDYGKSVNVAVNDIGDNEWVLELEDIEKDTANIIQRFSKSERQINGVRHKFKKGDVLYSKLRTYLNKVLIASDDGYCTTEIMAFSTYGGLLNDYICHILRSPYFLDYTLQCGYGVKMPRLSTTDACKGLIPLPPLAEQHRIVSKIEELFARLDRIEKEL